MTWNTITTQITGHLVTAAEWNDIGENMAYLVPVGRATFTSPVTVTATTEATANSIVSLGALTYENVPHDFTFYSPKSRPGNDAVGRNMTFVFFDSTTPLGEIAHQQTPAASAKNEPVHGEFRYTPSAASHTFNVKAWVSAGSGLVDGGAGGATGVLVPGFLKAVRVPT